MPSGSSFEAFSFRVTSTEATTNVTVQAAGEGLTFDDDTLTTGAISPEDSFSDYFEVTASTGGFHTLTLTVTADGAEPVSTTLALWAPGGTPLPGTDSLKGRAYGWAGTVSGVVGESSSRVTTMLTFVDSRYAYIGLPGRGIPDCPAPGCRRYYYDAETGLVQVGNALIGQVLGPRLYVEGLTPSESDTPDFYPAAVLSDSVGRPHERRYSGTWSHTSPDYPDGLVHERLALTKKGHFDLTYRFDFGRNTSLKGNYTLARNGELTFRNGRGRVVLRGTFLVREDSTTGDQMPRERGIWLILAVRQGKHTVVDGNRLRSR